MLLAITTDSFNQTEASVLSLPLHVLLPEINIFSVVRIKCLCEDRELSPITSSIVQLSIRDHLMYNVIRLNEI